MQVICYRVDFFIFLLFSIPYTHPVFTTAYYINYLEIVWLLYLVEDLAVLPCYSCLVYWADFSLALSYPVLVANQRS